MLYFSKKIHYALIALVHLSKSEKAVNVKTMAKLYNIPQSLLANIMKLLSNADIVVSKTGKLGGYSLLKSSKNTSIADIIDIMEGVKTTQRNCVTHKETKQTCQVQNCPAEKSIITIYSKIDSLLQQTTISEI